MKPAISLPQQVAAEHASGLYGAARQEFAYLWEPIEDFYLTVRFKKFASFGVIVSSMELHCPVCEQEDSSGDSCLSARESGSLLACDRPACDWEVLLPVKEGSLTSKASALFDKAKFILYFTAWLTLLRPTLDPLRVMVLAAEAYAQVEEASDLLAGPIERSANV